MLPVINHNPDAPPASVSIDGPGWSLVPHDVEHAVRRVTQTAHDLDLDPQTTAVGTDDFCAAAMPPMREPVNPDRQACVAAPYTDAWRDCVPKVGGPRFVARLSQIQQLGASGEPWRFRRLEGGQTMLLTDGVVIVAALTTSGISGEKLDGWATAALAGRCGMRTLRGAENATWRGHNGEGERPERTNQLRADGAPGVWALPYGTNPAWRAYATPGIDLTRARSVVMVYPSGRWGTYLLPLASEGVAVWLPCVDLATPPASTQG